VLIATRLVLFLCLLGLTGCGPKAVQAADPLAFKPVGPAVAGGARSELDARIEFLEQRMKQRPDAFLEQAELAGLYLQKGKLRQQTQQLEKAREWADRSLAVFPNNMARVVKADLLQMEHRFEDSLAILGQVLADEPGQLEARALAVRALLAQGKPEQADLALAPVAAEPLFAFRFLQGQIWEAKGDLAKAVDLYQQALGREREMGSPSESARLRAVWARLEMARGDLEMAQRLLGAAKAIPVEVPLVDLQRAKLAMAQKQWKQAADILRDGYALYQEPLFLMELGAVQEAQGQTQEAAKSYQAAADLIKSHPFGHERDRALALLKLDAKAHKAEILALMDQELARRRDPATLDVWRQVNELLGPLPEPAPFPSHDPIADAAKAKPPLTP
jgi:tetratricopeptide (TPR) repeat protein